MPLRQPQRAMRPTAVLTLIVLFASAAAQDAGNAVSFDPRSTPNTPGTSPLQQAEYSSGLAAMRTASRARVMRAEAGLQPISRVAAQMQEEGPGFIAESAEGQALQERQHQQQQQRPRPSPVTLPSVSGQGGLTPRPESPYWQPQEQLRWQPRGQQRQQQPQLQQQDLPRQDSAPLSSATQQRQESQIFDTPAAEVRVAEEATAATAAHAVVSDQAEAGSASTTAVAATDDAAIEAAAAATDRSIQGLKHEQRSGEVTVETFNGGSKQSVHRRRENRRRRWHPGLPPRNDWEPLTLHRANNWQALREQVEIMDENLVKVRRAMTGSLRSNISSLMEKEASFMRSQHGSTHEIKMLQARLDAVVKRFHSTVEVPLELVRDNITDLRKRVAEVSR